MTFKDSLGDRMKQYEETATSLTLDSHLPIIARIDGRAFSTWTQKMRVEKPYDRNLHKHMEHAAAALVKESRATVGYTQSDEVTLLFHYTNPEAQAFFGGKVHKLNSVLASIMTAHFVRKVTEFYTTADYNKIGLPVFDCRVFNVPTLEEAINCFVWRAKDCSRNAIQGAAQQIWSHKELQGVTTEQLVERLKETMYEPAMLPRWYLHGTYLRWQSEDVEDQLSGQTFRVRKKVVAYDPVNNLVKMQNRMLFLIGGEEPIYVNGEEADDA